MIHSAIKLKNDLLQYLASIIPGHRSLRIHLHRWRGVKIGYDVHIGREVFIEGYFPNKVYIGNNVAIGMRVMIIAHFRDMPRDSEYWIKIEDDVFIGPGSIILPNVTIGHTSVVCAGSVVTRSVPPNTMVRGNPARPIKKCYTPMILGVPLEKFHMNLKPIDIDK